MKSLNNSDGLWTNLSTKEVDIADYQAACCLNVKVNKQATAANPEVTIDNESVPLDVLRDVVAKADAARQNKGAIDEHIKVSKP